MAKHQQLRVEGISKAFPGVQALDNATLTFECGEVHALVGENGAGKSTLVKIIAGVHQLDAGRILVDGEEVSIRSPRDAATTGISVIHQEFSLFPELNVLQNLFIGMEITRLAGVQLNKRAMEKAAQDVLAKFNLHLPIKLPIKYFSVAEQQLLEIAKCLLHDSWFIIMDEPTSSLSSSEKDALFGIIRELRTSGLAIVYISHHLEEVSEIADRVSVLRDGRVVGTYPVESVTEHQIASMMVGKELDRVFQRNRRAEDTVGLEVRGLRKERRFEDVDLTVHKGEVLGLCGLLGFGQSEVLRTIFGLDRADSGEMILDGEEVRFGSPSDAIRAGVMYVPEDRKAEGLVHTMNVEENLSLPALHWLSTVGWIESQDQRDLARELIDRFGIKASTPTQSVHNLSGGNQQKVVIGKCLGRMPTLLLLNDPTRGIDVGAKEEIYRIIDDLAGEGVAIIMTSSELTEYVGLCDRLLVFRHGRIVREFQESEFDQGVILAHMLGVAQDKSNPRSEITSETVSAEGNQ